MTGRLHSWFTDYLGRRVQRVVIKGAASQWAPVTSGVPQGSLLGPLLFTIFINDRLEETVDALMVALYADDTKVYRSIKSMSDCISLHYRPRLPTSMSGLSVITSVLTPAKAKS